MLKNSYFSGQQNNFSLGKKLKILKNLESMDDKIKYGLINVIPKESLLNINENNFKNVRKQIKIKEQEIKSNLQNSKNKKNINQLTSFQKNELDKILHKEKIKLKKDIFHNHDSLLKCLIEEGEKNELLMQSIN